MRTIIVILTFLGIIAMSIGYVNQIKKCPQPKVEYRYVPRTFQQDQDNPVKIAELYHAMFTEPTPWLRSLGDGDKNKEINRYYISQI
jgi:ABC-type Mn2+/Zn2+ transport system ATPase subunit